MQYEWDEAKRQSNIRKHGIDFVAAIDIFNDVERIEAIDERLDYGEERIQTIGEAKPGILFVVYTMRQNNFVRRIISARIANKREKTQYFSMI